MVGERHDGVSALLPRFGRPHFRSTQVVEFTDDRAAIEAARALHQVGGSRPKNAVALRISRDRIRRLLIGTPARHGGLRTTCRISSLKSGWCWFSLACFRSTGRPSVTAERQIRALDPNSMLRTIPRSKAGRALRKGATEFRTCPLASEAGPGKLETNRFFPAATSLAKRAKKRARKG
jgi:hypothetical protein